MAKLETDSDLCSFWYSTKVPVTANVYRQDSLTKLLVAMWQENRVYPDGWDDDIKMTVMFSPFRDRNLNHKSWEQKVKFWSEFIVESVQNKSAIFDISVLKDSFRRKGKTPSCLETVISEMLRNGQIKKLTDMQQSEGSGWLSWGYSKLVKEPIGWSLKMLPWQQQKDTKTTEEQYVVVDVIKKKARELVEIRHRLVPADVIDIVDCDDLRRQCQDLCPKDVEFDLVLQQLCDNKQAVIQESDSKTKLVKFISPEAKKPAENINEQDIHIHRIRKANAAVKIEIDKLTEEIHMLGEEAMSLKKKGQMKAAMSAMRKRKMAQNRVDKLTGSMDLLDDVLYRIKQAESNEMILRALEGGSAVLKDLTGKTTADEVANVMDNLADITQDQDTLSEDLGAMFPNKFEEPSQSDLEAELSNIMEPDYVSPRLPLDTSDLDLEKELEDILKDESSQDDKELSGLLNDLKLPEVPQFLPGQGKQKTTANRQALTS